MQSLPQRRVLSIHEYIFRAWRVGTETQVVETPLMQRLGPTAVFLVLYSATGAGPLLLQGPVTVISLHFPRLT